MHERSNPHADQRAHELLRAHCLGVLLADNTPSPVRYMILPSNGALVIDADRDILDADEHVLMIPEERFDTPLSLLLEINQTQTEEHHDRHRAYHGQSPYPSYAIATILSAKLDSAEIVDHERIQRPNPLANSMSGLCRALNEDRGALSRICVALAGTSPENPTAVGVDPMGFHARTRFGVIRARFPSPCPTQHEAISMIESLLGGVQ